MERRKNLVIVDAANILRDDRGCIIRDENHNRMVQMRPERLDMVIQHIKHHGGTPVCILRNGTYHSGNKRKDSDDPRFGDWTLVEKGIESGDIVKVSDDDDMYCVTLALQTQSLLLSRDQFKPEKRKYPTYDWKRIDELRVDDYNFIAGQFVSPELDRAMSAMFSPGETKEANEHQDLSASLPEVVERVERSPDHPSNEATDFLNKKQETPRKRDVLQNISQSPDSHKIPLELANSPPVLQEPLEENKSEDLMVLLDELYAALYSLTADDGQCHQTMVLEMLAREFLGKSNRSNEWEKGWLAELKAHIMAITGTNQRPNKWVRDNLPDAFSYSTPYIVRK